MNISRRDKGQAMLRKRDQIKFLFTLARLNGLVRFLRAISNPPGFIRGFWARRKRWEKAEDPGDKFWRERWKQSKHGEKKIITFAPIIAFATLKAISLQLTGMLMMRKMQQAMQDDAIWARIHPAFIPVTGLTSLMAKFPARLGLFQTSCYRGAELNS